MKTAMQELIERLSKTEKQLEKENNLVMSAALFAAKSMALEYIEKEKEQIINAHLEGWSDAYDYLKSDSNDQARQAEDYYNETYNN
jgi:hypothetical protein